jgi:hypothetical protein
MFDTQAEQSWEGFSEEWTPWRARAWARGIRYAPNGTEWDGWDDEHPTQRAILIRAIRETPDLLGWSIDRSDSWHDVIARLLAGWKEMGEQIPPPDPSPDLTPSQSTYRLKEIFDIIKDS